MAVKAGYEVFQNGHWYHQQLSTFDLLKSISVGAQDFLIKGKQKEIVKWLIEFDRPIKVTEGFGDGKVYFILQVPAAKFSDEFLSQFSGAFGLGGGIASAVLGQTARFIPIEEGLISAMVSLAGNPSDYNVDSLILSFFSKQVTVRISCEAGAYRLRSRDGTSSSVISFDSMLSSKVYAAFVKNLRW